MLYSSVCLVFFSIVSIKIAEMTMNENVRVSLSNLKFTLFTRRNQINGITLNETTFSIVAPHDLTTIIIHGWREADTTPWMRLMKDTYLNKMPANIILIDWSVYARNNLYDGSCAVPQVGSFIGDLIYRLSKFGVDEKKVQIIGFSYGAHIAGIAGQRIFELTNSKVSRINGLDAGSPLFSHKPINQRLDASDAVFVQAIHTNNNGFGFAANYGTIDFKVNSNLITCGAVQPGCPGNPGVSTGSLPLPDAFCSHLRAVVYYIESITSDRFLGLECGSCFSFSRDMCSSNRKTVMGEMCPTDESGVRYLNTNAMSPFAIG